MLRAIASRILSRELHTLDQYRATVEQYLRWLASMPDVCQALENLRAEAEQSQKAVSIALLRGKLEGTRAAQSVQRAGVPESVAAKYFVYSDDAGLDEYKTDAERANAHADAIQSYLDCGSDGWSEQVDSVVSGVITHVTTKTRSVPNLQHADDCDCAGCEEYREAGGTNEYCEICDYAATPVAGPTQQQEGK